MKGRGQKTGRSHPAPIPLPGRQSRAGGSGGFTLLEVMIAVAVLAVGVVPLLVVHGSTVANLRRAREMTQAVLLARSRIATLETLGFDALGGEDGSDAAALSSADRDEEPSYLTVEEVLEEVEPMLLIKAEIDVLPKFGAAVKAEERSGIRVAAYIGSLYFEPEKEETGEE